MTLTKNVVLGIDIGGTNTKIGLVDEAGKLIGSTSFPTGAKEQIRHFFDQLKRQADQLLKNVGNEYRLVSIGIGAPNANEMTGNMEHPPNFNWGDTIPLASTVEGLFNLPVTITNDAKAAALGELKCGIAKGMKNFIVLTLGTGLGSGIIVNGQLLKGAHGMAGEMGHISVKSKGRKCNCGLRGCLETYASVTGVKRTVFKMIAEMSDESLLRSLSFEEMTGEIIATAALNKDPIALAAFEYSGNILGSKMADIAACFDPEAIILSGGLTKAGNILLKPVVDSMERNLFVAYKGKIKVLLSHDSTGDGVLGAAALGWEIEPSIV